MNSIATPTNIVAFREFMRTRFPEAHFPVEPGVHPLLTGQSLLKGLELAKGAITEVVASQSGAGLLIACLLEREGAVTELTALVDGSDAFDPWSVSPAALEKLLWLRCRETMQAVKATDLLLRDGNIPLILLDLQMQATKAVQGLPASIWHRLRLLTEKSGCCLCALTPTRSVTCARSRVVLEPRFTLDDQHQERQIVANRLHLRLDRQPLSSAPAHREKAIA